MSESITSAEFDAVAHLEPRLSSRTVLGLILMVGHRIEEFRQRVAAEAGDRTVSAGFLVRLTANTIRSSGKADSDPDWRLALDDMENNRRICADFVLRILAGEIPLDG